MELVTSLFSIREELSNVEENSTTNVTSIISGKTDIMVIMKALLMFALEDLNYLDIVILSLLILILSEKDQHLLE